MRRIVITSFAAALFAAALPASAETVVVAASARGEPAAQQPRARADQGRERQICVREQLSDSRMRRRVCHTAREWQQLHGEEANSD
jgi:hypothetical protein